MDPISLIIGAMVVSLFMTKSITAGRTDHELAKQGIVSPRLAAKHGSPEAAREATAGYGLFGHIRAAWRDYWPRHTQAVIAARNEREASGEPVSLWSTARRARDHAVSGAHLVWDGRRRPNRPDGGDGQAAPEVSAVTGDPDVGTVRFTNAGRERWDGRRWVPDAAAQPNESADQEANRVRQDFEAGKYPGLCEQAYTDECPHTPRHVLTAAEKRRLSQPTPDERPAAPRSYSWTCVNCGARELGFADPDDRDQRYAAHRATCRRHWCDLCGGVAAHPTDQHQQFQDRMKAIQDRLDNPGPDPGPDPAPPATAEADLNTAEPSTSGGTMSAPTGEGHNYEQAIAELTTLAEEFRHHLDECNAAEAASESMAAHIGDIEATYRLAAEAAQQMTDRLAALGLAATAAVISTATEALPPSAVEAWLDQVEDIAQVAKDRGTGAATAIAAVEAAIKDLTDRLGDADGVVNAELDGDGSFLGSGAGRQGSAHGPAALSSNHYVAASHVRDARAAAARGDHAAAGGALLEAQRIDGVVRT